MPARSNSIRLRTASPAAWILLLITSSGLMVGCESEQTAARLTADEQVAGGAVSPDYRQERMQQAMRGLVYDTGLVEIDQPVAAELTGGRNPQAAQAEYEEGWRMLHEVNDRVGAIAAFTRSVMLDPDVPRHYTGLGRALMLKGKMNESLAAFRTALLMNPDDFDAQLGLAQAMERGNGSSEDAILAWQRVLELDPSHDEAHVRLAILLYYSGDYAESWDHVHQAEAMGQGVPPQFRPLLASQMAEPQR